MDASKIQDKLMSNLHHSCAIGVSNRRCCLLPYFPNKLNKNFIVCRKVFSFVYGITEYSLNKSSEEVKSNVKLKYYKQPKWEDDQIHEFNHAETVDAFRKNIFESR